jgi:hypothetical protein
MPHMIPSSRSRAAPQRARSLPAVPKAPKSLTVSTEPTDFDGPLSLILSGTFVKAVVPEDAPVLRYEISFDGGSYEPVEHYDLVTACAFSWRLNLPSSAKKVNIRAVNSSGVGAAASATILPRTAPLKAPKVTVTYTNPIKRADTNLMTLKITGAGVAGAPIRGYILAPEGVPPSNSGWGTPWESTVTASDYVPVGVEGYSFDGLFIYPVNEYGVGPGVKIPATKPKATLPVVIDAYLDNNNEGETEIDVYEVASGLQILDPGVYSVKNSETDLASVTTSTIVATRFGDREIINLGVIPEGSKVYIAPHYMKKVGRTTVSTIGDWSIVEYFRIIGIDGGELITLREKKAERKLPFMSKLSQKKAEGKQS